MRVIAADLHIHSALSPCADKDITPETIVYAAVAAELDVIALCDHNSAGNGAAVQEAAQDFAGPYLQVLVGMEITTAEEVHVLGLFPDAQQAQAASAEVAQHLPLVGAAGDPYGEQLLLDAKGNRCGTVDRMLSFATDLDLNQTAALIRRYGGLVIPAHFDRPSFSITSQLGLLPENLRFDALEITSLGYEEGRHRPYLDEGHALIMSSDAHYLNDVGRARCYFEVEEPSFGEIKRAFRREAGRRSFLA
ncbi:MAG: PHP domain-containing protein [Candidatus Hydrogenedentales bacterium]|jgi:PHP family Zn ribbon phosphoesterase